MAHERLGFEHQHWSLADASSPGASMTTRTPPREIQENDKVSAATDLQTVPRGTISRANPNDRVLAACRRFRKVVVNSLLEGGDICMAVENCTTGSVPRKVISHLFGRNKVCTRRIPERVWVCMCRKHYQRMRYRKGADFSVTQIGMVYEQIVRMIFWSRGLESPSRVNQEAITIRSWTFSIRKRELKRLSDTNNRDVVPRWIAQSLGDGKSHDEILDIVERLHHEIQQGILKDVPPVEFLPEVVDAYTNIPAQISTHVNRESSNEIEVPAINHPGHLGQLGEAAESPLSFVKESSPLEPVQEEGSMSEHSSDDSSSPNPPATFDDSQYGRRPSYHPQHHEDLSIPTAPYSYGTRSPGMDPGMTTYNDGRDSLPYYDSQNPTMPSMNHFGINYQAQAPAIDPRGSHDNPFHTAGAQRGPSECMLIDRSSSTYLGAPAATVDDGHTMYPVNYASLGARDGGSLHSNIVGSQASPSYLEYYQQGNLVAATGQIQGGRLSFREPSILHPRPNASDYRDASLLLSMSDEHSNTYRPLLQSENLAWHQAESTSNTGAAPATNLPYWQPATDVHEASAHASIRHHSDYYSASSEAIVSYSPDHHPNYRGMSVCDETQSRGGHPSGSYKDESVSDRD
ncbi:hypothetical protein FALBO_11968 [Fusarium albosuccineum]|uniref:Uncharacterized protein n=1 Tax=Fusarium albosuccineum TaxID=1237068 RepID=A0A8H4P9K3_9HYPO|nr:hypothetical protein FALBO_11968 [Fusarium albosuccineum]